MYYTSYLFLLVLFKEKTLNKKLLQNSAVFYMAKMIVTIKKNFIEHKT